MRGAVLYVRPARAVRGARGPEDRRIVESTDAILRISLTCVCGSDLWACRGLQPVNEPTPMGHEYYGIVQEIDGPVRSVRTRQFVVGSFATSDKHVSQLPVRLPLVVHAPRVHHPGASASAARAAGRRDAGADAGRSF
jgi:threonine dehydrogenase-like Zn-dependent dehydrogenase